MISTVIVLITVALMVFLAICLHDQASLEVRFDAIISWLGKLERAVVDLDTHLEILVCLFALWLAKCQLPIPISILCVISGMVFSVQTAILINTVCITVFFYHQICRRLLDRRRMGNDDPEYSPSKVY